LLGWVDVVLLCSVRAALGLFCWFLCIARRFLLVWTTTLFVGALDERRLFIYLSVVLLGLSFVGCLFGYIAYHVLGTFDDAMIWARILERDRYPFTYIYDSPFLQNRVLFRCTSWTDVARLRSWARVHCWLLAGGSCTFVCFWIGIWGRHGTLHLPARCHMHVSLAHISPSCST
jgi:hypothetical protein